MGTADNEPNDAIFAARALARLPDATPSPDFSRSLLAGYAAHQAGRRKGLSGALATAARRLSEMIWPGAPLWAPGSALAAALIMGIGIGAVLPQPALRERTGFSLEEPPAFSLGGAELLAEER